MRVLPRWMQPILTEMTGKPLHDEQVVWWTGTKRLVVGLTMFITGMAGSLWLAQEAIHWWLLLPVTWLLTVSAARSFQTSFVHHASHGTLFGETALDLWLHRQLDKGAASTDGKRKPRHYVEEAVTELLSALVWIAPMTVYREDHIPHHGQLATANDPDLMFMVDLGMKPGLTVQEQRRRYWLTMISPRFHAVYLWARLRANFVRPPVWRVTLAIAYTVGVLALAWGHWLTLLLAVVMPVFPLYHIAGFVNMMGEHHWVRVGAAVRENNKKVILSRLTTARFFGEVIPKPSLRGVIKIVVWVGWWFRMVFLHFPKRLFAVPVDLTNHDWHHRYPFDSKWPNAAYARRDDLRRGSSGWPAYTESWGLKPAREATFHLLSRLPKDAMLGDPLTYGELAACRA